MNDDYDGIAIRPAGRIMRLPPYLFGKLNAMKNSMRQAGDDVIDLGWFTFIARPLLWLLAWLQTLVVNWGIAIILLTLEKPSLASVLEGSSFIAFP